VVLLFIYLVICNLHVQRKSFRANFSVIHSKLAPSMYFRLLMASYFMLLGRIWEWRPIWMQVKNWLRLWQIMVILFVYLVICNLHVQKKSIRANLSVRHSKLPPSMYFRLLRASYFMLLSRIWEWRPILNAEKKWLRPWQIMVI